MSNKISQTNWAPDLPHADTVQLRAFWQMVVHERAVVEVRILGSHYGGVCSGFFEPGCQEAFIDACVHYSNNVKGVYATLNPVKPSAIQRPPNQVRAGAKVTTADADIASRRWLPIDLDPVRAAGASASDLEHAAAVQLAWEIDAWLQHEIGLPDESIVVADSGNGAHLLARVDLPHDDQALRIVTSVLAAIDARFSNEQVKVDRSTSNAARIWKVYGTVAAKGEPTVERPHAMARLLAWAENPPVVNLALLERLASHAPSQPVALAQAPSHTPDTLENGHQVDLAAWLKKHNIPVVQHKPWNGGYLYVINPCPWNPAHENRSAYAIQHANGAVSAGCHHDSCSENDWRALRDIVEPGWRCRPGHTMRGVPAAVARQQRRAFARAVERRRRQHGRS